MAHPELRVGTGGAIQYTQAVIKRTFIALLSILDRGGSATALPVLTLCVALSACSPATGHPDPVGPETGLSATQCWFTDTSLLEPHACYYMTVNETPGLNNGRTVSFPIIVFDGGNNEPESNPVLHLGGGGPGASLALDSEYNIKSLYDQMRSLSVDQGRDLLLMDPRGAGQSTPLMMCQNFVDNVIPRWRQSLSIRDSYELGHKDFFACLDSQSQTGMDFSAYSSETVVDDLEQLREAMDYGQWVLYGASYASVYAQLYAKHHPERLQSMILDSATFLDTPRHEVLVREFTEPYRRLFNYCKSQPTCERSPAETEQRFWSVVEKLDRQPLSMTVTSPLTGMDVSIKLTGWRFLDSMLWGVYEENLFSEFPQILEELDRGQSQTTRRYVEDLLIYLMDDSFGDISASSHYCIDRKPYIDDVRVKEEIGRIPYAYVREIARLGLEFVDYCDAMSISATPTDLDQPIRTAVPTLFIHGELDSVTLLDYVRERREYFDSSHLVVSTQAHIVIDDPCIQRTAARFVRDGLSLVLPNRCSP